MSMYSNRLQPAVQNLLQRVVRFFHPRSSCPTHISVDVCSGRKSLIKPVNDELSPEQLPHTCIASGNWVIQFLHPRSSCTTTRIYVDV